MTANFKELANASIRNLTPYKPGKPIEEVERELGLTNVIKLASNENPLGPSPKALAAAQQALIKAQLYPDGSCYLLKQELAKFLGVDPEQLTIGNGSENVLEVIVKAYLTPVDSVVISQYAFATIPILINALGANLITVPAKAWGHDIKAMIAAIDAKTRIVFIVNPNNPTGTYTTNTEFITLLNSIPPHVIVVADEAYVEYMQPGTDFPDTLTLLKQYPNLIISRTFSKIFGLAGLRTGYGISSPEIADILNRARLPFNVNSIAQTAACAALSDKEFIQRSITINQQGMKQLEAGFKKLSIDYIPSIGNFISINVKKESMEVYQALLHQGIIVRPLTAYGMPTHLRITIGTEDQNVKLLQALALVI